MREYKQGKYRPKNPLKYEGDISNIVYRSSWELRFLTWCDNNTSVISYSSEETIIPYLCPTDNRYHRYFVDFKLKIKDINNNIKTFLVEIKPNKQTKPPIQPKKKNKRYIEEVLTWGKNSAKWEAARMYCKQMGYEFMILDEYQLGLKRQSKWHHLKI